MRVLVTGSQGQLGHSLVEQLQGQTESLLAVDRDSLDITDRNAVIKVVNRFRPTIIINAAAHTAVDKAEDDVESSYAVNRDGPQYLAEAADNLGAALLHVSTDYVFSGTKKGIYVETDEPKPLGVYGASKLAGEQAALNACRKCIVLRTSWVFSEHGNNFVKTMLKLGNKMDSLKIVGDQIGGPTYAGDIAITLIRFALEFEKRGEELSGIYHYSGLPHVSWFEFAQSIFEGAIAQQLIDKAPKLTSITTAEYPTPAIRPANSRMSNQKLMDTLNIIPCNWKKALSNLSNYT